MAEKGDMLDFKLDGGGFSAQTFEGVDYAKAAQAQAEMLGVLDIGKRERRTVAYNETHLYQQQIAAIQGSKKKQKKRELKLPKSLRLPRMEEWQMYQRGSLQKLQEEEEVAFKALPEEQQKLATQKAQPPTEGVELTEANGEEEKPATEETTEPFELPPMLSEERQAEKDNLLAEGFSDWTRQNYSAFIRASAKFGRTKLEKIAVDVGKPAAEVKKYADAFWDESIGKKRFTEHEYERVVKLIERGEKKMDDVRGIVRGTEVLISIFDNPWDELEFTFVNMKDKMFTADEDRYLLCWAYKVS
jgi:SWI/SNF-related matrix-associated actin-dependent regulator of chromatin subfamily A member 5